MDMDILSYGERTHVKVCLSCRKHFLSISSRIVIANMPHSVGKFRAYRDDIPLPYDVPQPSDLSRKASITSTALTENDRHATTQSDDHSDNNDDVPPDTPVEDDDPESAGPNGPKPRRSSNALNRAFTLVKTAHKFDFERRRPSQSKASRPNGLRQALSTLTTGSAIEDEDDISTDEEDHEEHKRLVEEGVDSDAIAKVNDHVDDLAGLRRRTSRIADSPSNRDHRSEQHQHQTSQRDFAAEASTSKASRQDKADERKN